MPAPILAKLSGNGFARACPGAFETRVSKEIEGLPELLTTAKIIVDQVAKEAANNFYLTVNEHGRGRVVVNEIGHSVLNSFARRGSLSFLDSSWDKP